MLVVSHESVGVVAFSLWAAFELHLEQPFCRDRDCGRGSFGCPRNNRSLVDPVPNESLLGDPGKFVKFLPVKGLVSILSFQSCQLWCLKGLEVFSQVGRSDVESG